MQNIVIQNASLQNITILGSTGTIGQQTLDVIARHANRYKVYALAANSNVDALLKQCLQYQPKFAVLLDEKAALDLRSKLKAHNSATQVLAGLNGLIQVSSDDTVDTIMAAIVGAAGLQPAMAAAHAGKRILLANKETLVMAGSLFMEAVKKGGATLLPIDSEHNAIFQVMPPSHLEHLDLQHLADGGVKKIILTASGGPFRQYTQSQLENVTPELALKHPNWVMGAKITIDSASLMNKGLEVIEAHWLFNAKPSQIEVVVHPQSIIHSMVEYVDGSKLEFEAPDKKRFPCLQLAYDALALDGTAPAILNAVNEVAVEAFLNKQCHFLEIAQLIQTALDTIKIAPVSSIEQLIAADNEARSFAQTCLLKSTAKSVLTA
jgi:1-deoxy-D-xylulose-5-phosphate reductoisomerase